MRKFVAAVGILLPVIFGSQPGFSQNAPSGEAARKAELAAAWQAAGPADIPLIDRPTLKIPTGEFRRSRARAPQNDRRVAVNNDIKEGLTRLA